jgi:hypothetical protein
MLAQLLGETLNLWAVTRLWTSTLTDIVVLRLTPYSPGARNYRFRHLTLDLLPPWVGERINAFGFRENVTIQDERAIQVQLRPSSSQGTVAEIHHERRDAGMLRFPCFRTNARFDHGMSGGPVFNSSGHLCGLICDSLPAANENEEHASYAASLWPAMAIPIDIDRAGRPPGVRYHLFELVADNILVARNADRIILEANDGLGTPRIGLRLP